MRKHQESLLVVLTGGQACGMIRGDVQAEGLTLLIQGSIRLLVSRWRMAGYSFDLVEEGRGLLEVLRTLLTHDKWAEDSEWKHSGPALFRKTR